MPQIHHQFSCKDENNKTKNKPVSLSLNMPHDEMFRKSVEAHVIFGVTARAVINLR